MSLHVLIGTANAGKTKALYGRLIEGARESGRALLLVPSPADASRAMAELSTFSATGVEVTTLGSHLDECWRAYGDGRRLVTPVERAVVLEESGSHVDSGCLTGSVGTAGFRRLLANLVQRVAESDAYAGSATRTCATPAQGILAHVDAYRDALVTAGLVERGEAYRLLADQMGESMLPPFVALCGFTGLTGPQERYLIAASRDRDVLISLTYAISVPATESAAGLVSRLSAHGTIEAVSAPSRDSASPELVAIEQGLGSGAGAIVRTAGAVVVSEAWGASAESARIVREIQDAVAEGIPSESIAVVFRDPALHIGSLRQVLREAGIAAEWDVQVPFERTGIGRILLSLLAVCAGTADRATWMDVMRSPYSPATGPELDDLDARVRRSGVTGASAANRLEAWSSGKAARFIRAAHTAFAGLGSAGSESDWHQLAIGMLGRAYPSGAILDLDGMLDSAAVRVLIEAISGLTTVTSKRSAHEVLAAALRGTPVSVAADGEVGRIQVTSAERVRGRRFRCVIVGGLTVGEFPRVRRDEGFGAYGAEAALAQAGIDIAPRDDITAERLLFYQVVTRAHERLVLSRRSHDENGQPLQSSIFLEEVLDLYVGDASAPGFIPGLERKVLGPDTGMQDQLSVRSRRRMTRAAVYAACTRSGDGPRHAEVGAASCGHGLSADAIEALSTRQVFSVSDIETYLQCPYRWYIERVIRPSELDETADASTAGRVAHDVLAVFYERLFEATAEARLTPENLEHGLRLHQQVVSDAMRRIRTDRAEEKALLRRAIEGTRRVLLADAQLLSGFQPRYREWSFGMDDEPERFEGFSLRGRIDRIDVSGSHLLITDYKLGGLTAAHGAANLLDEGRVQLPLYALVASRRTGLAIAGGVYRSVTRDTMRGFITEELAGAPFVSTDAVGCEGLEQILEGAQALARSAIAGMRAGEIEAAPARGRCATFCAARGFCQAGARHA